MQRTALRAGLALFLAAGLAQAAIILPPDRPPDLVVETELVFLALAGVGSLPLAQGWEYLETELRLSESVTRRSLGRADAWDLGGGEYYVESFFDVYFDLSLTDVDPAKTFPGGTDDQTWWLGGNGPARFTSRYSLAADALAPHLGLLPPPEAAPWVGLEGFGIPLGIDINGNGEADILKFDGAAIAADDVDRGFITLPDGSVLYLFESMTQLSGGVVDLSADPPFQVTLYGTGIVQAAGSPPAIPEPGSLAILGGGLLIVIRKRRR